MSRSVVSINQPAYLPWLGYFERIAKSDIHIVLDDVQFEKNSFTNRNKVRTKDGWCWLTVPLKTSGQFGAAIDTVEIADDPRWPKKHWETIKASYRRAPYFAAHEPFFSQLYGKNWTTLNPLLRESTSYLLAAFGIKTPIHYSSQMIADGKKDELVLQLCQAVGATVYLSGALGRNYLREPIFRAAGIEVQYQDYAHPQYQQGHAQFEPYMAAIDLLFNEGPNSLRILTHGG